MSQRKKEIAQVSPDSNTDFNRPHSVQADTDADPDLNPNAASAAPLFYIDNDESYTQWLCQPTT